MRDNEGHNYHYENACGQLHSCKTGPHHIIAHLHELHITPATNVTVEVDLHSWVLRAVLKRGAGSE